MKIAFLLFFAAIRSTGGVHATTVNFPKNALSPNHKSPSLVKNPTFGIAGDFSTLLAVHTLRHLDEDTEAVCTDEEDAFDQCINAQPEICGGEGDRKLSAHRNYRHLEDETCDSLQFDICGLLAIFNECPCGMEYIALQDCVARDEFRLECNPFSTETCDEVPCVGDLAAAYQCIMSNPGVCPQTDERRKLTSVGNKRSLEDFEEGDFDCEDLQIENCYISFLYPECPCSTEYNVARTCEAEQNGLFCDEPSADACESSCLLEELTFGECFSENISTCSEYDVDGGQRRLRRLDEGGLDYETCDEYQVAACALPLFFSDCPCIEDYKALLTCSAKQEGLICDEFTLNNCDICPYCEDAVDCFDNNGICYFDPISMNWTDVAYEGCNYGASKCKECYPNASCKPYFICSQCAAVVGCYDETGYCFLDSVTMEWGEPYEDYNQGADICSECFPDATCKCGTETLAVEQCVGVNGVACNGEDEARFRRHLDDTVPETCVDLQEEYCSYFKLQPDCPCDSDYFAYLVCTYEDMGCTDFTNECNDNDSGDDPETSPPPTPEPTALPAPDATTPVPTLEVMSGIEIKNLRFSGIAIVLVGSILSL